MKYLYLHGLGQKPDSWNRVIKETKVSKSSASLSLSDMLEGKSATYKELYSAFSSECDIRYSIKWASKKQMLLTYVVRWLN